MPKPIKRDLKDLITTQLGHDPARIHVMRPYEDLVAIYGCNIEGDPMRQVDPGSVLRSLRCQKSRAKRVI